MSRDGSRVEATPPPANNLRGCAVLGLLLLAGGCQDAVAPTTYVAQPLRTVVDSVPDFADADADAHRNVYVAAAGGITVYAPAGEILRRVSLPGAASGAPADITALRLLNEDSLLVFHAQREGWTVVRPQSTDVAYTVRLRPRNGAYMAEVEPAGPGRVAARFRLFHGQSRNGGEPRPETVRLLNADGSVARDSLVAFPEQEVLYVQQGDFAGVLTPDFAPRPLFRALPGGGFVHAWTDSARVTWFDRRGRRRRALALPGTTARHALSAAHVDSVAAAFARGQADARAISAAARGRWRHWPAIADLRADPGGRLWIARHAPKGEAQEWLILDSRGRHQGTFRLPAGRALRSIRGDTLLVLSSLTDGTAAVHLYQLLPQTRDRGSP